MNHIQERIAQLEQNLNISEEMRLKLRIIKDLFANLQCEDDEKAAEELLDVLSVNTKQDKTKKKGKKRTFIEEAFYEYLLEQGRTENCACDYLSRIRKIFVKEGMNLEDGLQNKGHLEKLYSEYLDPRSEKYKDNIEHHHAPSSALKQFLGFLGDRVDDDRNRLWGALDEHLELSWSAEYQSFRPKGKHEVGYDLVDRGLTIHYEEGFGVKLPSQQRVISKNDYADLVSVFQKYKGLLSRSKEQWFDVRPFGGGGGTYRYRFQDKENKNGSTRLFEGDNEELVEEAYREFNEVMSHIL